MLRQRKDALHDERESVTHPDFDEAAWIERLAAALEQVAAEAEPSYSPPPPLIPGPRPIGEYWSALHRGYRALAARANTIRQPPYSSRSRACGSRQIPPKR